MSDPERVVGYDIRQDAMHNTGDANHSSEGANQNSGDANHSSEGANQNSGDANHSSRLAKHSTKNDSNCIKDTTQPEPSPATDLTTSKMNGHSRGNNPEDVTSTTESTASQQYFYDYRYEY